jgi:purine-binding chemotaxis protein CheW
MEKNLQIVAFRVGHEMFGLPISVVREIVRVPEITAVPNVSDHIEGVINLRGQIIPVLDLPKRFCVGSMERGAKNRVVVVEVEGRPVGLIVDSVSEVLRLTHSEIEAPRNVFPDCEVDYISGVGKPNGRLVILLDLKKITQRGAAREFENLPGILEAAGAVESRGEG